MKFWIFFFFVFLFLVSVFIKNYEFMGKVIDQVFGEFFIGVNVFIEGISQGMVVDFDGSFFLLSIDFCFILVVFYIGYEQ